MDIITLKNADWIQTYASLQIKLLTYSNNSTHANTVFVIVLTLKSPN